MFYLTSKFYDNRVNTFGFMGGGAFEVQKGPGGIGLNSCVYVIFNESFRVGFYRILYSVFFPSWVRRKCCPDQVFPG